MRQINTCVAFIMFAITAQAADRHLPDAVQDVVTLWGEEGNKPCQPSCARFWPQTRFAPSSRHPSPVTR